MDSVDNVTLDIEYAGRTEATIEFSQQEPGRRSQLLFHSPDGEQNMTAFHEQVRGSNADVRQNSISE